MSNSLTLSPGSMGNCVEVYKVTLGHGQQQMANGKTLTGASTASSQSASDEKKAISLGTVAAISAMPPRKQMGLREGLARKRLCEDILPPSETHLKALEVKLLIE